jgi:hypothetical protein
LIVEALYTDFSRISEVVTCIRNANNAEQFDGLRINFENGFEGETAAERREPTTPGDIQLFADAAHLAAEGDLPLHVSISFHWDEIVEYDGNSKSGYQHSIDQTDGVDIQVPQDSAATIQRLASEEVNYAEGSGRTWAVTIETSNFIRSKNSVDR